MASKKDYMKLLKYLDEKELLPIKIHGSVIDSFLLREGIQAIPNVSGSLRYSEREIDLAYLVGVFNVSGFDGLQKEIERLKGLGKNPHDIIIAERKQ